MLPYIKLFRPLNLFIIALTQYLVLYCIVGPFMWLNHVAMQMSHLDFALFVIANVLLAAAGYAINDYYDTDIDSLNKPAKNMLLTHIPRRQAYLMNIILNTLGCIIGFYVAYQVGSLKLGFLFVVVSLVMFYYSLKYKRQFITGNLVVALLSAYAVLSVWLFQFFAIKSNPAAFTDMMGIFRIITYFVGGLAAFAFLTALVREIIKDMEDYEGDKAYGCDTIPVRAGIGVAKKTVMWISIFSMLLLAAAQYLLFTDYVMLCWYLCIVQAMFIYLIVKIMKSKDKADFHFLSLFAKIIMITGLLATQMLYIYF